MAISKGYLPKANAPLHRADTVGNKFSTRGLSPFSILLLGFWFWCLPFIIPKFPSIFNSLFFLPCGFDLGALGMVGSYTLEWFFVVLILFLLFSWFLFFDVKVVLIFWYEKLEMKGPKTISYKLTRKWKMHFTPNFFFFNSTNNKNWNCSRKKVLFDKPTFWVHWT